MSIRVLNEVLDFSRAQGTDRNVVVALSESAAHDGVTWLPVGQGPEDERRTICRRARCSKREALRAIACLRDELFEVQTVKVRRGRSFITVYRVVVGSIADVEVDYDRLPFELPIRFGQGAIPSPSTLEAPGAQAASAAGSQAGVEGANQSPSTGLVQGDSEAGFKVPPESVQGDGEGPFRVTDLQSRPLTSTSEPSRGPSAAEPSSESSTSEAPERPAAAVDRQTSLEDVKRVVRSLRSSDAGTVKVIEPLALQLPAQAFLEIVGKVDRRRATGNVDNDAGLLVRLLRIEVAHRSALFHQAHLDQLAADGSPVSSRRSWIDTVIRERPDAYVRYMAKHLTNHELAEVLGEHFDATLREVARAVRDGDEPAAASLPESPTQARMRWIDQHAGALPDSDIAQAIDSWDDVDAIERGLFHEHAESVRDRRDDSGAAAA